ncbi:prolipoprotein diacylglyceryl transferase family protein [Acanthopleuribacter pedis]|uniref:Prolipoprotein diacylglyceryl transferase n=1 Tax=Acanthopleuribacter pedis TaxID=442870 RepID=A0A8J7U1M3_9BACT|nr:prolipoprotein diacylglyceryl transferase [Acanthopleuribacter pedis]
MHPILFEIFGFEVPSYGVALVTAFIIATILLRREGARLDLDPEQLTDAAVSGLLFGLIGAKLLLIIVELDDFIQNPAKLLDTIRSAGVIYGGQIGGALGVIWYLNRHKLPIVKTLDVMAPHLALGIGLGRVACLLAGCCYGVHYDGPFALHFPEVAHCPAPAGVGLFPIQIVSLINGVVLYGILIWLLRRRKFDGQIVAAFVFLYGLTRAIIENYRGDGVRGVWFDGMISTSQLIALGGMAAAIGWTLWKFKGLSRKNTSG